MWGKVSCLRKQHNGRDLASKHRPSDLKSNALTTSPLCPHRIPPLNKRLRLIVNCCITVTYDTYASSSCFIFWNSSFVIVFSPEINNICNFKQQLTNMIGSHNLCNLSPRCQDLRILRSSHIGTSSSPIL